MPRIHQEVTFAATPAKVYRALMDAVEHAKFTGEPAEISGDAGGTFSVYGGKVLGRNIELVADKRIVQAWRTADWPEGVFSIARFELSAEGNKTKLVFDQAGAPDAAVPHLETGWHNMYWNKIHQYLGT